MVIGQAKSIVPKQRSTLFDISFFVWFGTVWVTLFKANATATPQGTGITDLPPSLGSTAFGIIFIMMLDETADIGLLGDLVDEESVRKLFSIECPVCSEIPLPPIYLCSSGHIICSSCQERTYSCPLCRERYCNTRSFVAEGIVEKCNLRCRYADGGCKVVMKGCDLGDHLPVCEYRPINCRECGDKLISYCEYEHHLVKKHNLSGTMEQEAYVAYRINQNINFMKSPLGGLLVDTCFWPQYFIKVFNQTFLLRLNAHQLSIHPWICLFGHPSDCDKYTALIEYEPNNDGGIVHSWKGPVNHFRDLPIDVIAQGKALSIPVQTILGNGTILNDRAEWIYHIVLYEKLPSTEPCHSCSPSHEEESFNLADAKQDKDSSSFEDSLLLDDGHKRHIHQDEGADQMSASSVPSSSWSCRNSEIASHRHRFKIPSTVFNEPSLPLLTSGSTNKNQNPSPGVAAEVRTIDRRPQCAAQSGMCSKKNERTMDSAGNHGDIDDYSDVEWYL